MDQRAKGGTTPPPSSPPEDPVDECVGEKKRRGEGQNGDTGKEDEEERGAGRTSQGEKAAVLELLIEGRCGGTGQRHLHFPGTDNGCPEGNVRLRIGLQTKRTKKPPKILESYVCKPTIRTYQRQGKGEAPRGNVDVAAGQQGRTSPAAWGTARVHSSALDTIQIKSKQTASTAPSPPSSSSLSLQPPPLSSTAPPALASTPASPVTKPAKEVPIKLSNKAEVNSNGSSEKVMRDKLPGVSSHTVSAGHKMCSVKTDQTASTTPSTLSLQTTSAVEPRNEGGTHTKHNGLVQTGRQKELSNGKSSPDRCGTTKASKAKVAKLSISSSSASRDVVSLARPLVSSNLHKEPCLSQNRRTDSVSSPSAVPKTQPSALHLSPGCSQIQGSSVQHPLDKRRDKEKKTKREKRKDKRSKRDKGDVGSAKSEGRVDEGKKKKKEKGKDGKSRHGKARDERGMAHNPKREGAEKIDGGKGERKRDKLTLHSHKGKEKRDKPCETDDIETSDKVFNVADPDEREKADETSKTVMQDGPAAEGDNSKSKEQDIPLRHQSVPPSQPTSPPPSRSPFAACSHTSPSSLTPDQDSRPLKKRKARRHSWTRLVQRVQRGESQEAPLDSLNNSFPSSAQKVKQSLSAKALIHPIDETHLTPSSSSPPTSPLCPPIKSSSLSQSHPPSDPSSPSRYIMAPTRKRGRPKSHASGVTGLALRCPAKAVPDQAPQIKLPDEESQKPPAKKACSSLQSATQHNSATRKRGRPPKRPLLKDSCGGALSHSAGKERYKDFNVERGTRQLKIRKLISEMKKRKRKRLYTGALSECGGREIRRKESVCEGSSGGSKSKEATTTHALSALSFSFGDKLGPQINVSKRGTIYMGKRRGRKPKVQTANTNSTFQSTSQTPLFTNLTETTLFSSHQLQTPASHPFPSPSLTHSSGAQSPYSEGSFTEPSSSLLFPHPFSLPSPSSSCTSPHPPSSSSLSPFVKKSCPCQGRHHFPFHQSSCKLSSPTLPLHHTPGSPAHLKEATPSPRSESHSEETLPSDSGIGTDNNSVSERGGEMRAARGMFRIGQGSGLTLGRQRHPSSLANRPSLVTSPLIPMHRHTHPITTPVAVERHRERHRHRRRDYDCVSPCTCMCSCTCQGHNKYTHLDSYPCIAHNTLKRQKIKHKKKHQQLHMHDPEFLAELEDLIGQFSEVHIGRRGWPRSGPGQSLDGGGGNAVGARRHQSSPSHPLRSNIFRINLNGFYSPHPSSYSTNPSFNPQPFYPCQSLHCGRKPDRRQCGCPSKFQETIDDMGFYRGYPPTTPLYPHLHSSYPLPPPHQYVSHQPHHPHFLLNPARFHRRRSRLMRDGGPLGAEGEGEIGRSSGGGPHHGATLTPTVGCGRSDHKHKHKHRHRHCDRDVEAQEEEHSAQGEGSVGSKPHSALIVGSGEGGRKGSRGTGNTGSTESPWLCKNGKDSSSSSDRSTLSLPTLSAERFKHTSLTSLGLGSSHLSSFGGGWGGLGQSWMKIGGMGGLGFRHSNPSWSTFAGDKQTGRLAESDGEEEEVDDDFQQPQLYSASQSPTHTNLFTSAAMATGRRGLKIGTTSRSPGYGEQSWSREELSWRERRGTGLQGDTRSHGQRRAVPAAEGVEVKKRGPGRPRKHPLPSPVPSPTHSPTDPHLSSPGLLQTHAHSRDGGRGAGARGVERERAGGDDAPQQTDAELAAQASRKRGGWKRKLSDSTCSQSPDDDKSDSDDPTECFDQSELDQAPPRAADVQWEERADCSPRKKFLRAGLYSDDYKTTDPPSQDPAASGDSLEYLEGEHEYSLLPAPINVGKYLRLKRIDFQLPYDVLWLWRQNQLYRQPAVPLKRKRHYCRIKERSGASQQALGCSNDITSLFPHLEMEPMTSSERSFVVKHSVFLVRNWELVREKQIQLRIERERQAEGVERDVRYGDDGDDSNIQSDQSVGFEETDVQTRDTSSSVAASPHLTQTQNRRGEEKTVEKEVCNRELQRKRLNNLLLALRRP